jgi:hypothetical protein
MSLLSSSHLITEKYFSHIEKQRYDGWYNNLAHPDWGAVGKYYWNDEMILSNDFNSV